MSCANGPACSSGGGRVERLGLRGVVCLAGAVRSADSVQVCPVGSTCGGRLLSGLRRTVVSKEGISRLLGEVILRIGETVSRFIGACAAAFVSDDRLAGRACQRQRFSDELRETQRVLELRRRCGRRRGNQAENQQGRRGGCSPLPPKAAGRARQGSSRKLWGFGGDYLPRCLFCLLSFLSFCLFCLSLPCLSCVFVICAELDYPGFLGVRYWLLGCEAAVFGVGRPHSARHGWGCPMSTIFDFEKKVRK